MNKKNLIPLLVLFIFCGTLFGCSDNSLPESSVEETTEVIETEKTTEELLSIRELFLNSEFYDGESHYDSYLGYRWMELGKKSLMIVLCNKSDLEIQKRAIAIMMAANEWCGFSPSLLDRMATTSKSDGVQYESNSTALVSWEVREEYTDTVKLIIHYYLPCFGAY